MAHHSSRYLVAGFACFGSLACTLASLDGLAAPDRSGDAAAENAAADAAPADATPPDAAADAGRWCARQTNHALCEDFDLPTIDTTWDRKEESNGGRLVIDSDASVSPPSSLLAVVADAGSSIAVATLTKFFSAQTTHVRVEAEIWVEQHDNRASVDVLQVKFDPVPDGFVIYDISVGLVDGRLQSETCTQRVKTDPCAPIPLPANLNAFHRVALDVTLGATPSATVFVDDGRVSTAQIPALVSKGGGAAVGVTWSSAVTSEWRVHADNVTIDAN